MTDCSAPVPTLIIAILSSQSLVWFGLQKILESSASVPMVVHPYPARVSDLLRAERRPDVFILDLDTDRDAIDTIHQIRESTPTSKIVLLCGLGDKDRAHDAFAAGVDGILLKIQPPTVVLAVLDALYIPVNPPISLEQDGPMKMGLGISTTKKVDSDLLLLAWPEALTEREREIIRLVGQGLSNKEIAYTLLISDSTVRHHMTSIFDKVGVPNRQKLLLHAHQFRATPVE